MGDVAHELAPGIVVGLDIVCHLVEGAGKVGHLALAVHALDPDGQVAAAEALGRVRHLLERVGELVHHHLREHAGQKQHQAGREEKVREELSAELRQPLAGRAEKEVTGARAVLAAHLTHRDVAFLRQHTAQCVEEMVVLLGLARLFQHLSLHRIAGQLFRHGRQHHIAVAVGEEQIGLRALADDLELGAQGFQLFALGQRGLLHKVGRRPLGDIDHLIQRIVPLLRKIPAEEHQLRAAHDHRAEDEQSAHERKERDWDTFAHY